jgi:hypothetical protein
MALSDRDACGSDERKIQEQTSQGLLLDVLI